MVSVSGFYKIHKFKCTSCLGGDYIQTVKVYSSPREFPEGPLKESHKKSAEAMKISIEKDLKYSKLLPNTVCIKNIKELYLPNGEIQCIIDNYEHFLGYEIKNLKNQNKCYTIDEIRNYMLSLLWTLNQLHLKGIAKRNIMPKHLAVKNVGRDLRFMNFEFAEDSRMQDRKLDLILTNRNYTAPEAFLFTNHNLLMADVWSAGCIFAELLLQEPIIKEIQIAHRDSSEQTLALMVEELGFQNYTPLQIFFKANLNVRKIAEKPKMRLLKVIHKEARELVLYMLRLDPRVRFTLAQALAHDFFRNGSEKAELINRRLILEHDLTQ